MNGRQNRQQRRHASDSCWPCCSTVVLSGVINVTVTTKIKACGWRNVLVVQIESIKSPPAGSASGIITRRRDGVVSCLFVHLFAAAGAYRVDPCLLWCIVVVDYGTSLKIQWWRQFFAGVMCHYSPAIAVYSALSATRVHSRQTRVHCRQ